MHQPSHKEIIDLAVRLGEHDHFDKKWVLYPAFATPPPRSKVVLDQAFRYRQQAARILRHEEQPPAWLIRDLAPEHEPRMSVKDILFLEEIQQYYPAIQSLEDLEPRNWYKPRKWKPEPKPLHTIHHYPGEFRRIRARWPLAVLCLWQRIASKPPQLRLSPPLRCWRSPHRPLADESPPMAALRVCKWVDRCTSPSPPLRTAGEGDRTQMIFDN